MSFKALAFETCSNFKAAEMQRTATVELYHFISVHFIPLQLILLVSY